MTFNKTQKQEEEYLQKIIGILNQTINNTDQSVKDHVDTLQEYKDYLWSNKDIDPHEIRSMRESILNHFALGENVIDKRRRLSKLLDIPYFGRIDFKENKENSKTTPIYIGIHTFYDSHRKVNLIYDWRAPISSIFYDHESGEATYSSPTGEISGKVLLKRQYRIRKGKMEYMIESSLTIHDDILQKELSANTDDKMKNIVTTIQREQNRIIRNENARILIIQGVAGSGKTSIALHRIAYLLYTQKGNVSSKNILIISPNKVFGNYISNVLPELGEESVPETSMEYVLSEVLDNRYKYQNSYEQVTELLEKPTREFIERIKYKNSFEFISLLDKFILYMENTCFKATDVRLTKYITIPAGYIEEQFKRFNRYPMRRRFEAMTEYILEMMTVKYNFTVTTTEKNLLKKEIKGMFEGNNDIQVYKDFFEWAGKKGLMKCRITLRYSTKSFKNFTLAEKQFWEMPLNPYGSSNAKTIQRAFATSEIMKLCKSYRSTFEITNLAQKIQPDKESEPVMRHGEQPDILQFKDMEGEISGIADLISTFKKSDYQSLGIVCKTEAQAKLLTEKLQTICAENLHFLSNRSSVFVKGIIITAAHMAKGLEFDEVIVPQTDSKNYHSAIDRSMLYVAVTRAMHKLSLTYCGIPSLFIEV